MAKMVIDMAAVQGGVEIKAKTRGVEFGAIWSKEEVRGLVANLCEAADLPAPWK
jgi:hypothetical protein